MSTVSDGAPFVNQFAFVVPVRDHYGLEQEDMIPTHGRFCPWLFQVFRWKNGEWVKQMETELLEDAVRSAKAINRHEAKRFA